MAGDDVRALGNSMSVGRLFRASTEDDESIAQMIELLDYSGRYARCEAASRLGD